MNELSISLTGEITSSNFNEWKQSVIEKIQAVKTNLTTDADFASAVKFVKQLKSAEKALKKAKKSALEQASDIQTLFASIDEVSEKARQARLTLERQIKQRKNEIKSAVIDRTLETIQRMIDEQGADFKLIDHAIFLDRHQVKEAMKRKTSLSTMDKAAAELSANIEQAIKEKAVLVINNALVLDSLAVAYQPAFQDRGMLLALSSDELSRIIDQRLESFRADAAPAVASTEEIENKTDDQEEGKLALDFSMQADSEEEAELHNFSLVMRMRASDATARSILSVIKQQYADNGVVTEVSLSQSI
ncbi:MAG: hypothetical protein V3V12_00755 [Gammaproteobacteria bacterium]